MRLLLLSVVVVNLVACSTGRPTGPSAWMGQDPWTIGDAAAESPAAWQDAEPAAQADDDGGRGLGHRLLWYIPNRISDVLDIVRARVRVGPGFSIGARATELADIYFGAHASVFVGIPGPRRERSFNWPFGYDSKSGLEVSVVDATVEGGTSYGWLEFGVGTQLLIVGFDVGVDPWEVVDFALGLVTIDLGQDDI